ncbi:MAG: T9SS type A sorting domain-containing protein, partial [Crocinitomicaceae bacterium]|nr:T9SS type A sorting domain-containing protein [Crocinitomicaceae bacterium]
DMWLIILDLNGNEIIQETYGGSDYDAGSVWINPLDPEKLFFTSTSLSGISGNKTVGTNGGQDAWIMELDASAFLNTEKLTSSHGEISVFPNPFVADVTMNLTNITEDVMVSFFTIDGKQIKQRPIKNGNTSITVHFEESNQVILYEVTGETIHRRGKLVSE